MYIYVIITCSCCYNNSHILYCVLCVAHLAWWRWRAAVPGRQPGNAGGESVPAAGSAGWLTAGPGSQLRRGGGVIKRLKKR